MAARTRKILKSSGQPDKTVYARSINKEITKRLKDSGVPMFQEIARYEDVLGLNFRHNGFVRAIIGKENFAQYEEAVFGAIIAEASSLTKDALTGSGVTYPGVWTDHVLQSAGWSLLHQVVTKEGKYFLMVDTINLEESRKSAPWPAEWTNNDAYSCPPDARMAYDDYNPDLLAAIIIGLSTAITGRTALLSINKYAPHVVFTKDGTIIQKYAKFVKTKLEDTVNNWVYNECDVDSPMKDQIRSLTKATIPELIDLAASLAVTGGTSESLVKFIMDHASIAPAFDGDKFDDIEDPNLKVIYTITYKREDKVLASTFEMTPVHILKLCCDKKSTIATNRNVGRMVKDILGSIINLCITVATDDPEGVASMDVNNTPGQN